MKVYLLFIEEYDNQPSKLIGVFSSEENANKCKQKHYFSSRGYVKECIVDEIIKRYY
ncbi:hypothetical protein [Clostridium botulinum]|uniref:DUF7336 domain-containing protein n=1 Tax=Clostridium botulinum TaxID=1491 RepID=UPI001C9B1538|nr:hypothetical protein [Clostridium botulinum]MBY6915406.1 hypothetical protein [Clostridium botulinum]